MVLNFLQRLIDILLRVDRKRILNDELAPKASQAEIAAELRDIIEQLKLEAFDTEKGLVNYQSLKNSPIYHHYRKCAGKLRYFDPASLSSHEEKLAFWINLYNSLIINAVISFGIKNSIWEAGWGFFRKTAYNIGGLRYSADDIEHGILRGNRPHPLLHLPQLARDDPRLRHAITSQEPRIHFTLVCASSSCPPITVYHAPEIEEELEAATSAFINGGGAVVEPKRARISLSRIFAWYKGDFNGRSGVIKFILSYLRESPEKDYLRENADRIRLRYRKYDWSLNHY